MPIYTFTCTENHRSSVVAGYNQSSLTCPLCGNEAKRVFDPGIPQAILREGSTGGWASKSLKEKTYRARRWDILGKKTKDHVQPAYLVPNYQGETHDRWSEVQDHVRDVSGQETAKTYDAVVAHEKSQ